MSRVVLIVDEAQAALLRMCLTSVELTPEDDALAAGLFSQLDEPALERLGIAWESVLPPGHRGPSTGVGEFVARAIEMLRKLGDHPAQYLTRNGVGNLVLWEETGRPASDGCCVKLGYFDLLTDGYVPFEEADDG